MEQKEIPIGRPLIVYDSNSSGNFCCYKKSVEIAIRYSKLNLFFFIIIILLFLLKMQCEIKNFISIKETQNCDFRLHQSY